MTRDLSISEAQAELRSIYLGASMGLGVAGLVWLASAMTTVVVSTGWGIAVMLGAGFFIYPLTQLGLTALGGPASVPKDNPLRELSVEVPLVGPIMLPLVGAAALYRVEWFFPAMMLAMGAHYLPFSFLYGMPMFIPLGAIMSAAGVVVALWAPELATAAAAGTALLLFVFAGLGYRSRDT